MMTKSTDIVASLSVLSIVVGLTQLVGWPGTAVVVGVIGLAASFIRSINERKPERVDDQLDDA